MTDPDEIIVLSPDDPDADYEDYAEIDEPVRPKRLVWPWALLGGLVAGGLAATAAIWMLWPDSYDASALEARIDTLESEVQALRRRPAPVAPQVDLSPLERRIAALEDRPTVDPLSEEIVARMEALQAEGFTVPEMPEPVDLAPLEARLSAMEERVEALTLAASSSVRTVEDGPAGPVVDPSTLPRFPAQTLREGASEMSGSGLIRRTLSRHVRVRGEDTPDALIDTVEAELAAGRPAAALATFDRLPPRLQSLARGWRADMQDVLTEGSAP
ncbi:MAG: hypothetical protein AAF311_11060 [Pseudomonadota bacterium]